MRESDAVTVLSVLHHAPLPAAAAGSWDAAMQCHHRANPRAVLLDRRQGQKPALGSKGQL